MSKKNKLSTRRNRHKHDLEREKAEAQKKQVRAVKKATKLAAKPHAFKKKKTKAVRVRKHLQVKGVRVVDAETKRKARELLAAGKALDGMDLESGKEGGGWEEATEEEVAAMER